MYMYHILSVIIQYYFSFFALTDPALAIGSSSNSCISPSPPAPRNVSCFQQCLRVYVCVSVPFVGEQN